MKSLAILASLLAIALASPAPASAGQGHYIVLKADRLGNVQPIFHRAAVVPSTARPAKAARDAAAGDPWKMVAEGSRWSTIVEVPRHVRGEFAENGTSGRIRSHRVPVVEKFFVLRVPASAGSDVAVRHQGKTTTLDLVAIAARSSSLPLARAGVASPKLGAAPDSGNRLDILVLGDGYLASEQDKFQQDFEGLRETFAAHAPYGEYANLVNWQPLFTPSLQSGADHPPYQAGCTTASCCADADAQDDPRAGIFVDTAFDAKFCTSQIHRLVTINYGKVYAAAAAAPHWDQIIVLVNDPVYGGAGGGVSVATTNQWSSLIAVHEFGHSFTELADEYTSAYPGYPACSDTGGGSPCEVNVTNQTDRNLIKWNSWIGASTPIPTPAGSAGVGLFQGARYMASGMYRPEHTCGMRDLGAPFCNICTQAYILALYAGGGGFPGGPATGIDLIEPGTESPAVGAIAYATGSTRTFGASILRPAPDTASIQWYLDGQPIPGATTSTFSFRQTSTLPAMRTLELRVVDDTPFIMPAMAGALATHSRTWTINVAPGQATARSDDFNGDGVSDLFWHNTSTLASEVWRSADNLDRQAVTTVNNRQWRIVGAGDFNGDGRSDLLWRNTVTGTNGIWLSADNANQQAITGVTNQVWQVNGTGDFNGDGTSDILWRNSASLANVIWLSGNNATQQPVVTVNNRQWSIAGVGDFDGDGTSDLLWRNGTTGANAIWRSADNATQQPIAGVTNRQWTIVGVGDFNGDGRSDILWHNTSTLANAIWLSGNNATQQPVVTVANQAWSIAAVGDYNGDGRSDILWRNASTKANTIWLSGSNATQQAVATVRAPGWQVLRF